MIVENKNQKSNRIPIRFFGDDDDSEPRREPEGAESSGSEGAPLSPEEIGSASSYEDETEVRSRINEGHRGDEAEDRPDGDESDESVDPAGRVMESEDEPFPRRGGASDNEDSHRSSEQSNSSPPPTTHKAEAISEGPMLAELIATRAELKRVESEVAEYRERLSRRQADFDNYRKRVERDRGETYNRMVGDVVGKLLPVLDNFRRALDAEAFIQDSESEEFRHFLHGVQLILKQLEDVLDGLGLKPVDSVGQPFDPHIHEAVVTEQTDDYEPDTVMQELVRGYRLGDKLLRPAMVKVATRS